jgi:hypothetical protein
MSENVRHLLGWLRAGWGCHRCSCGPCQSGRCYACTAPGGPH